MGMAVQTGFSAVTLLSFGWLTACETAPGLTYQVAQPASNSHAAELRRVAVMGFSGWRGGDFARQFDAHLRNIRFQGRPWFDVTAPTGDPALYSSSSVHEHARAIEFGTAYGLDGVWFGDVNTDSGVSPVYYETRDKCVKWVGPFNCKTRVEYTYACQEFSARANVRLILMDVAQETIVVDRTFFEDDDDEDCWELGPSEHAHAYGAGRRKYGGYTSARYELETMEQDVLFRLVNSLRNDIAPFTRSQKAELMETPSLPYVEMSSAFGEAVELAQDGRPMAACRIYESLEATFPEKDPALSYNLAACAEMTGDLELARSRYKNAVELGGQFLNTDFMDRANRAYDRLESLQINQDAVDYLLGIEEDVRALTEKNKNGSD